VAEVRLRTRVEKRRGEDRVHALLGRESLEGGIGRIAARLSVLGFVDLLARRCSERASDGTHVVFTAHSLPARILEQGDPYRESLLETSALVADQAGIDDWPFAFQSESPTGEPWLGPDTPEHLAALHGAGVTDVLACPVGFVSDHLEIRWDLDVEAAQRSRELGMRFARIETPNAAPELVETLAGIVRRELAAVTS